MAHPQLNIIPQSRSLTDVFRGYNHNRAASEGEWYNETNISSSLYPLMTHRAGRSLFVPGVSGPGLERDFDMTGVTGMVYTDDGLGDGAIVYTKGRNLYYQYVVDGQGGNLFWWDLNLNPNTEKQIIIMGAYIVVFPDKKYANKNSFRSLITEIQNDYGSLEASADTYGHGTATFVNAEGEAYADDIPTQDHAPEDPANGDYWIDTSTTPNHLKVWSDSAGYWQTIETTYIKITCTDFGKRFKEGDGITIEQNMDTDYLPESAVINKRGDDFIIIPGILSETKPCDCIIWRDVPKMDYVTLAGNRIWGCRFSWHGDDGKMVNEIYASKLGDFKNWNVFEGLSTDSYVATIGKDGEFTGAVTYMGYPCFFKEDTLLKVYIASNGGHQIQETDLYGIEKGSWKSAVNVGQVLYYKSVNGVMAYDGSLPVNVSAAFGGVRYRNAVAGEIGGVYYISMEDYDGGHHLFTYDIGRGIWNREDDVVCEHFVRAGDILIAKIGSDFIRLVGGESDEVVMWSAESAMMGTSDPDAKYLQRIDLMVALDPFGLLKVEAEYDHEGQWITLAEVQGKRPGAFLLPIRPRRCKLIRLRISGEGNFRLYSISKVMEAGSDR